MEENRIKIWIHKIKDTAVVLLHFLAVCSPLSLVCVTTPELLAGETIGQWVWFGKAVLFSTGCIVVVCLLQLFYGSSRKEMLSFSSFSACVSWSLILLGGTGSRIDDFRLNIFDRVVCRNGEAAACAGNRELVGSGFACFIGYDIAVSVIQIVGDVETVIAVIVELVTVDVIGESVGNHIAVDFQIDRVASRP